MTNSVAITIGVVVPLVILIGAAGAFIWYTERKRKQSSDVSEIPYRPRITSFLYRGHPSTSHIEDGIEVCSTQPSIFNYKHDAPVLEHKAQHELPNLKIGEPRSDSAVQSPIDTHDQVMELEGTLGKQLSKAPSEANLRHSSDEQRTKSIVRKDIPSRASLQPYERYYTRSSLQPATPGDDRDRMSLKTPNKDNDNAETDGPSCSPTVSAISEVSGRGRMSHRSSDVPDIPSWIRRMSVQDTVEESWSTNGKVASPVDTTTEKGYFI